MEDFLGARTSIVCAAAEGVPGQEFLKHQREPPERQAVIRNSLPTIICLQTSQNMINLVRNIIYRNMQEYHRGQPRTPKAFCAGAPKDMVIKPSPPCSRPVPPKASVRLERKKGQNVWDQFATNAPEPRPQGQKRAVKGRETEEVLVKGRVQAKKKRYCVPISYRLMHWIGDRRKDGAKRSTEETGIGADGFIAEGPRQSINLVVEDDAEVRELAEVRISDDAKQSGPLKPPTTEYGAFRRPGMIGRPPQYNRLQGPSQGMGLKADPYDRPEGRLASL
ncbi:unnamed protein product [Nesidiocoris tenuis]|uniref:Uncharacterized protein n=1 Tax=Nesidiocoris tenuis TaxID=355587 RepID=A0A6H5GZU3_9HEMI|nr:unnamed protein product [Nesidiocoris tenuis]